MRAGGLEPPRALLALRIFLPLRLSPPPTVGVRGLDYPFTVAIAVGAARLVSTPSLAGLARGCHIAGFPEFEQFCILGFPQEHSSLWPKSVASTSSATPAPQSAIVREAIHAN